LSSFSVSSFSVSSLPVSSSKPKRVSDEILLEIFFRTVYKNMKELFHNTCQNLIYWTYPYIVCWS
jgi:hypothetical protein